ncbi:hypothetical protein R1flu_010365 [Riccia fluitans]|uniref:Uncharacterized protein n=1 Tax=Riccia fluitans TaxID=41844 RepID=A0ABD1Z4S6_9MARC
MAERMGGDRSRSTSSGGMGPEGDCQKPSGNTSPGPRRPKAQLGAPGTCLQGVSLVPHMPGFKATYAATGKKHRRAPKLMNSWKHWPPSGSRWSVYVWAKSLWVARRGGCGRRENGGFRSPVRF